MADELLDGVETTLAQLRAQGRLQPEHEGLVQAARQAARLAESSSGVAASNFLKQLTGILDKLLALEVPPPPPAPEEETDDAGHRITKLSQFLRGQAGLSDVRHPEAS